MTGKKKATTSSIVDQVVRYLFAFVVVGLIVFVVVRNQPFADPNIVTILRTVLAFAMGAIGVTIPGFLNVQWRGYGFAVRAGSAAAFVLLALYINPTVLPTPQPVAPELPKSSSLNLRIVERTEDTDQLAKLKDGIPLKQGILYPLEFILSNPLSGLAMVDELSLEVLDVTDDVTGSTQTVINSYMYGVELTPQTRGRVRFGEKYKYAPGEADRIILGVFADLGTDYFVRLVVKWYDDVSGQKREIVSEPFVIGFPAALGFNIPIAERNRREQEQERRIEERLQQLRKQSAK